MKIALLASAESIHTRRWCHGLARRGHDIRLISIGKSEDAIDGILCVILPGRTPLAYFRHIPKVIKALREFRPDIVHAHYVTGYGLWGVAQKSAPLVASVWGTDIYDAKRGHRLIRPIVRQTLRRAAHITATSRFLLDETVRFEPAAQGKITQIPFGIEIRPDEAVCRQKSGPIQMIFTKHFLPTYAPGLVLSAFAVAIRKVPEMKLLMIGGGPLTASLISQAAALGISARVSVRPWADSDEVLRLIGESDIMVMPSHRESFGVAAVEAAAAGLPVIATRVGGIPEIIADGENGILVEPGNEQALANAMVTLATDKSMRERMGRIGKKISAERFDIEKCLDQMEAVYHRVLGAK